MGPHGGSIGGKMFSLYSTYNQDAVGQMFQSLMNFNYDDYNGQEYQDRPWNVLTHPLSGHSMHAIGVQGGSHRVYSSATRSGHYHHFVLARVHATVQESWSVTPLFRLLALTLVCSRVYDHV